jgi:hypothetical protein
MDILHPVGDGFSLGNMQVVGGNGDGVTRFEVLSPSREDASNYVSLTFAQAVGFDTMLQARSPIAFGDGVLRGRFAVLSGNGGIELAVSLWAANPMRQNDDTYLIASTRNFTIWHTNFQEYALPLIATASDMVARFMGDLWLRTVVVNAPGGFQMPKLGVGSLWIEVPKAADAISFQNPTSSPPPVNTLVTVSTFSRRTAQAKLVNGEWYDASDQPFGADSSALPNGSDGLEQPSRAVKNWGQ